MSNAKYKSGLSAEQQNVVDAMMKQQVFVRAGAGTGKTFTMVEGIVQKLREHLSDEKKEGSNFFDHVFMITFTNNAAAELKTRLRAKLLADEDEEIRKQADLVENAWVSTIHGLCSRILREHALEVGVDPQFEICSESQRTVLLQQACDEVCQELQEQPEYKELFEYFGYNKETSSNGSSAPIMALAIAEKLSESVSPQNIRWVARDNPAMQKVLDTYPQKIHQDWKAFLQACQNYPEDKYPDKSAEKWQGSLENNVRKMRIAEPIFEQGRTLEEMFYAISIMGSPAPREFSNKECGGKEFIERLRENVPTFLSFAILRLFLEPLENTLMSLAKQIKERFDAIKRAEGLLDNNDLLEKCYRYLIDNRPADLCGSFHLAVVDEFQDTNEQQLKIVELLAKDDNALCFVGDAQQSIYRFRGADLDMYQSVNERAQQREAETGEQCVFKLTGNYRSAKTILDFVERIFNAPEAISDFLPLSVPPDKNRANSGAIEEFAMSQKNLRNSRIFVEYTKGNNFSNGGTSRHLKANNSQIANCVLKLIEESNGAIKPKDIAVLTTSADDVDGICHALTAAQIDAMRVNQKPKNVEVFDAIEKLLIALANPADTERGVLPLLLGPLFELDCNDLLLISNAQASLALSDFFNLTSSEVMQLLPEKLDKRTYRAFDVLSSIRKHAGPWSVSELVEHTIKQSGWLARIDDDEKTKIEKAASVYRALDVIRTIIDKEGYGIAHAAEHFALWLRDEKGRAALLNSSDKGAVTVETIHQSKGLQYPIVIVAGNAFSYKKPTKKQLLLTSFSGKTFLALLPNISKKELYHAVADRIQNKIQGSLVPDFFDYFDSNKKESNLSTYLNNTRSIHERYSISDLKSLLLSEKPVDPLFAARAIQLIEEEAEMQEGWRLLYVAMTRAEHALVLGIPQRISKTASKGSPYIDRLHAVLPLESMEEDSCRPIEIESPSFLNGEAALDPVDESIKVNIRTQLFDAQGQNTPTVIHADPLNIPPFKAYEEHEMPLAKVPWRESADVGSYSSDAHQQALIDAAEKSSESEGYRFGARDGDRNSYEGIHNNEYANRANLINAHASTGHDTTATQEDGTRRLSKDEEGLIECVTGKAAFRFGTAFHALGELAALTRKTPTKEQIIAQATLNQLNSEDADALEKAVHAWWNSSLREEVFSLPHLLPEYPFFMEADAQSNYSFTRGFIDLLAHDGKRAIVVDYKTGEQNLTEEEARSRHQLQADWYARALLNSGFEEVTVKFILVQNEKTGAPLIVDFGTKTIKTLSRHD